LRTVGSLLRAIHLKIEAGGKAAARIGILDSDGIGAYSGGSSGGSELGGGDEPGGESGSADDDLSAGDEAGAGGGEGVSAEIGGGEIPVRTGVGLRRVTSEEADLVESAELVAVTETVLGDGSEIGAV
jgi:hypothetical protein